MLRARRRVHFERFPEAKAHRARIRFQLRRLWPMLAHRHAQLWNGAELGEAYPTVKRQLARRQAR